MKISSFRTREQLLRSNKKNIERHWTENWPNVALDCDIWKDTREGKPLPCSGTKPAYNNNNKEHGLF